LDICRCQIQNFADPHTPSGHQLQHEPVPSVCGPEDDLIDNLFIDNIPLNSLCAFEDLSDDGTVAGIGEGRQPGVDAEVVEGCQYRLPVPFRCLSMVLRHGKEKLQDLLLGDAGEVTLTKSPSKSAEHELTCLDGIFFRVGSVVPQMEIDRLGNIHVAPRVVGVL